ncbi:hypothetical protein UFOVP253_22 [uncultured Caudovirales phage]|uniref:Uncharacterized protein n=1 Tax=uncultured Caudovirales phage TaxID=2100421 RepID=A0A6J5LCV1_9CAUD|nr:hypothetical protein UFOVP253_22 [uncultured Caudovirales phage]
MSPYKSIEDKGGLRVHILSNGYSSKFIDALFAEYELDADYTYIVKKLSRDFDKVPTRQTISNWHRIWLNETI